MSKKSANGRGSVYQDSAGRWWAQLPPDERGRRPKRRAASESEAVTKLRELERERDRGMDPGDRKPTVEKFYQTWLDQIAKQKVRPSSLALYEQQGRLYIIPRIGRVRMHKLSTPLLQKFINTLAEEVSPNAAREAHKRVRTMLKTAVRWKLIPFNFAVDVELPKAAPLPDRAPSAEDVRALLRAAAGHELEALLITIATFGLRIGEAYGLAWRDLDWTKGTLKVSQQVVCLKGKPPYLADLKTDTSARVLPVPPAQLALLRVLWDAQSERYKRDGLAWNADRLIFPSDAGKPAHKDVMRRDFDRLRKQASVTFRLHDLRHYVATSLAEAGITEAIIGAILGHGKRGTTTRRYTTATLKAMRAALETHETTLRRAA